MTISFDNEWHLNGQGDSPTPPTSTEIRLPDDAILGTDNCIVQNGVLCMYNGDRSLPNSGVAYPIQTLEFSSIGDKFELIMPYIVYGNSGSYDRTLFALADSTASSTGIKRLNVDNYNNTWRLVFRDTNGTLSASTISNASPLQDEFKYIKFVIEKMSSTESYIYAYTSSDNITYSSLGYTVMYNIDTLDLNTLVLGNARVAGDVFGTVGPNASIDLTNCSVTYNSQKLRDFVAQ